MSQSKRQSDEPMVIPRTEHPISRKLISQDAIRVLYRLKDCGYKAYIAGGGIRDLLLGVHPKDFDIVTDATPSQVKRVFRNCRIIGRRFKLAHVFFGNNIIEVATFRSDSVPRMDADISGNVEDSTARPDQADGAAGPPHARRETLRREDGLILRDNVYGTPRQDALRRDFTINALFYNIDGFAIIDYVGGMRDLHDKVIRSIGDPAVRFAEDPVRMIRAIRFASKLGFRIEQDAYNAMCSSAESIVKASNARMYEEMLKLFCCGGMAKAIRHLRNTGLWAVLFPGVAAWADSVDQREGWRRIEAGCAELDSLLAARVVPEPPLVYALVLGGYIEHKAKVLVSEGLWPAEAVAGAVSQFIGEMSPRMVIPKRIGYDIVYVLVAQSRLGKTGGSRADRFASRHFFRNSLSYFSFMTRYSGGDMSVVSWWESFARKKTQGTGNVENPKR